MSNFIFHQKIMAAKTLRSPLVIFCVILFSAFIMLAIGIAILGNTLINWWATLPIALLPAISTAIPFQSRWRTLSGFSNPIANAATHIFVAGSLIFFLFLGLNYWGADKSTAHVEHTTIIDKHSKEHTRYRRVGRNRRVPDGKYNTWHLTLEFADGRQKDTEVTATTYRRSRIGNHRDITLQRGLFSIPVIKNR